jgi:hypothetical protein
MMPRRTVGGKGAVTNRLTNSAKGEEFLGRCHQGHQTQASFHGASVTVSQPRWQGVTPEPAFVTRRTLLDMPTQG